MERTCSWREAGATGPEFWDLTSSSSPECGGGGDPGRGPGVQRSGWSSWPQAVGDPKGGAWLGGSSVSSCLPQPGTPAAWPPHLLCLHWVSIEISCALPAWDGLARRNLPGSRGLGEPGVRIGHYCLEDDSGPRWWPVRPRTRHPVQPQPQPHCTTTVLKAVLSQGRA